MTLLAFEEDYLTWDGVETVRYEAARRPAKPGVNPDDFDRIEVAKRRMVRGREKSPSGGVYVGYETRWLIPQAMFAQGFIPKPADVIQDRTDTRWTVLTADVGKGGNTWQLGCVDLVLAAALFDVIDVQRPQIVYDAAQTPVKTWPQTGAPLVPPGLPNYALPPCFVAKGLAARVQRTEEAVEDQRGIRAFAGKYEVTVAAPLAVTFEDRIAWKPLLAAGTTLFLDLTGTRHAGLIDELLVIDAEARP